jgi:hypothetical protein
MVLVQRKGPPTGSFNKQLPCGWKSPWGSSRHIGVVVPQCKPIVDEMIMVTEAALPNRHKLAS